MSAATERKQMRAAAEVRSIVAIPAPILLRLLDALDAATALADEWLDAPADGECPDGWCGACSLGVAGQRLTAALTHPDTDPSG